MKFVEASDRADTINRISRLVLVSLCFALSAIANAEENISLIDAVKMQDLNNVRLIVDQGVNVNQEEADGTRALHWAVHHDNVNITKQLIAAGANVNAKNRYEVAALSLAANNGNKDTVSLLLDSGADVHTTMSEGEFVILTAARTGVAEVVELLLDRGAEVNATESWRGQTPLMWAAAENNLAVVNLLLSRGANLEARSGKGFTALLFAAREGHTRIVDTLLNHGADITESLPARAGIITENGTGTATQTGLNALLLATGSAHFETASLLLDAGADPNHSPLGWTTLHQISWVRKMGQSGSNNPTPEGSGELGSLDFVRELVEHGANLNALVSGRPPVGVSSLNMEGSTPFLLASRSADIELLRLLVDLGADPEVPNIDNSTPLMVAAGLGTESPGEDPGTESEVLESVEYILSLGGDINAVDDRGNTAMHGAAYKHLPSVVNYLNEQGAEISIWDQENEFGHTPLLIAEGIHRGMNIVSSKITEQAIREILDRFPLPKK
ncbi:MAG: ankyrin repeat domain-containing protein [Gammaproteobacteria bacterium]|nr:ankyrin repeat domain-containing protein [Gammaproteobacteria bacterium]